MKVRQGFVSNSSSSSFIVKDMTVIQVAIDMVPARRWDERQDQDTVLIEKLLTLQKDPNWDDDTPLAFRSCNYDTYLLRKNGIVFVETCNNHSWYDYVCTDHPSTEELSYLLDKNDAYFDTYEFSFHEGRKFYWPEDDMTGITLRDWCKDCYTDLIDTGEVVVCKSCKKTQDEIGYKQRKTNNE